MDLSNKSNSKFCQELNVLQNDGSGDFTGTNNSHTASEFINSQLQLEAEAREALPYKFENCTKPLGKIRQIVFSCLTCNPFVENSPQSYQPAGICYSCSIQCHGDHTLVELFYKRDFECDCGTTRLPMTSPCTLRIDPITNERGGIHSEQPSETNKYNQNFRNRFCGCECDYNSETQKGTMFQCLGLGSTDTGGCGEDWWHSGCIVGLEPDWYEKLGNSDSSKPPNTTSQITQVNETEQIGKIETSRISEVHDYENTEPPLPPGFPDEDDFDGFICYKCLDSNSWLKSYAGTPGFLPAVFRRGTHESLGTRLSDDIRQNHSTLIDSKKRSSLELENPESVRPPKRFKNGSASHPLVEATKGVVPLISTSNCRLKELQHVQTGQFSLFFKEDFRSYLCHCNDCFPRLQAHPQLLEPEETYEPSISTDFCEEPNSTAGSGSLYDRGESALRNIDRVRAIEGVMAYNHLKDKLKPFFQQFAESGKAISAEDIKAHFAKIRGDELGTTESRENFEVINNKREQSGY